MRLAEDLAGTSGYSEDCIGKRNDCRVGVEMERPGCEKNLATDNSQEAKPQG